MRRFWPALLLLVMPPTALAATDDAADVSSANLVNLNYYARPGLFHVAPSFSSAIDEINGSADESSVAYELFVEYGLPLEGLRVSIAETDGIYAANNNGESYYFSGLGDPTLRANYRFVDAVAFGALPGAWAVDAQLSVVPGIGTYYLASSIHPGTNARGYTSAAAAAAAFWRAGFNETRFSGELARRFSGTQTSQLSSNVSAGGEWVESLSLTDRVHFLPRVYFQVDATFEFGHSIDYSYADGDVVTVGIPFNIQPEAELGVLVAKNVLFEAHVHYAGYTASELDPTLFRDTSWGMSASIEF